MRVKRWKSVVRSMVGIAAVSLASVAVPVLIAASPASAAPSAPPWEPDGNAAPPYGNVVFYDSSGNEVTSGTNLDSPFAYAVATTTADTGATKAIVNFYNPQHGVTPANWVGTPETGTTTFSPATSLPAGTPADIKADAPTHPISATSAADITSWISTNVPDATAGYANTIQVRLTDTGPGGNGNAPGTYWETDIGYNNTGSPITVDGTTVPAGSWVQLFPFVTPNTTSLSTSASGGTLSAGSPITLTATVSTTDAGTVVFYDGSTVLGDVAASSGGADFTYNPAGGAHSYTASFVPTRGDETNANTATAAIDDGSTSPAANVTVTATVTTTTVDSSANPSVVGQQVTYTSTVSPTPDHGNVEFFDGATAISGCSSVALTGASATCHATYTAVGSHSITAEYLGDALFDSSTSSPALPQAVNKAASSTVMTASPNPAGTGASVLLHATVTVTSPGAGTPSGMVTFEDGGTAIGSCAPTLAGGAASCSTTALPPGTDSLTAVYGGDTNFLGSTSPAVQEHILPNTTTAVTSSLPGGSVVGQAVTYTATVTAASGTGLTGKVTFVDGATSLCSSVPVSGSGSSATATCTNTPSTAGAHHLTATYANDPNFAGSSGNATQTVNPVGTTTSAVTSSTNPSVSGQEVTYAATVAVTTGSATPTGTVSFDDPGTPLPGCSAQPLSAGRATCVAALPAAGSPHDVTAVYAGSANFTGSSSPSALTQAVNAAATTTTVTSSRNPSFTDQAVTYTATITVTAPGSSASTPVTGTVAFSDGATPIAGCTAKSVSGGQASCAISSYAAAGSHTITAVYSGDANFTGSTSGPLTQTVQSAAGYWMVGRDGGVFTFGTATFAGSLGGIHLAAPIVAMANTPDRGGYWLVGSDGGVFAFGDAAYYGSLGGIHLVAPIVGIIPTTTGHGYWLIAQDGGVFSFGDAGYHGSLGGLHLVAPIVGGAATPTGHGYWLVGSDGGVFAFGDASYHGSLGGIHLSAPIVGMAGSGDGAGYLLVGRDGGAFAFGDAVFHGSLGALHLAAPIVQIIPTPDHAGYWMVGSDGGVFSFGDALYHGSVPAVGVSIDDVVGGS